MPSQFARNAALEGEYASRELAKHKAFKTDKALLKSTPTTSSASVTDVYQELVAWVQELFGLAVPGSLIAGVATKLAYQSQTIAIKVSARLRENTKAAVSDPKLTPVLALYTASSVAYTTEHLLSLLGRIVDREAASGEATPGHLWAAVSEDQR